MNRFRAGAIVMAVAATTATGADMTAEGQAAVKAHEAKFRPLDVAGQNAWWDANTTGSAEAFKRKEDTQNAVDAALADKAAFAKVKALKAAADKGDIHDKITARAIQVMYLLYLEKQVDPALLQKITAKANAVEKAFNAYRATVGGSEMADSKVRSVLKSSTDSKLRQQVWEASKGVGPVVAAELKELVLLRNEAARQLGFKNYHVMMLTLNEQDGAELLKLFDDLDTLTRKPFEAAKSDIDARLAKMYGVKVDGLQAWHYHDPFFQESPAVYAADLDAPFRNADILGVCKKFYAGIGLPIDDVIARSDLYEKPGKSPHAFCTDIDREGDVRVLANIVPTEYWAGTMLHELGHSVYSSKNIPAGLPYVLRSESHILSTEGVAMQFERFSKSRQWVERMGLTIDDPAAFAAAAKTVQRNQLLIFSRWCQVMLRFEKGMYENPDQDLNALWWTLVEKYQGVKKPARRNAPDYASKIHIVSAPVYYHNYMLGQLFASQVHHAIARDVYNNADPKTVLYIGDPKIGTYMRDKVFAPGRSLTWKELTVFATGSELTPAAFAADFQE